MEVSPVRARLDAPPAFDANLAEDRAPGRDAVARQGFPAHAWVPAAAAAVVLAGQLFRLPALGDAATGGHLQGFQLDFAPLSLALTPLFALADFISLNDPGQNAMFFAWVAAAHAAWRLSDGRRRWGLEASLLAGHALCWAAFLAWGALAPRPAARLAATDADTLVVNFHSHTTHSRHGRRGFSVERNMAWHRGMGFHAGFITDHETNLGGLDGRRLSRDAFRGPGGRDAFRALVGEEVSIQGAHIVVLGSETDIRREPFLEQKDLRGFFREVHARGGLAIVALPEWWTRRRVAAIERLADWGADGFEIANASPRALGLPEDRRRAVVKLCRERNLILAGATDSHGWGRTSYAWNLLRVPGWRELDPDRLQAAVMAALNRGRFGAVRVAVRARHAPEGFVERLFDPALGLFLLARTLCPMQALSCFAWIGLGCLLAYLSRRRRTYCAEFRHGAGPSPFAMPSMPAGCEDDALGRLAGSLPLRSSPVMMGG